jgi:hypothetical protein
MTWVAGMAIATRAQMVINFRIGVSPTEEPTRGLQNVKRARQIRLVRRSPADWQRRLDLLKQMNGSAFQAPGGSGRQLAGLDSVALPRRRR